MEEWTLVARSRLRQELGGESFEYPGRTAICPRGHVRVLPTRFSRSEFPLRCHECGRDYQFREQTSPDVEGPRPEPGPVLGRD